LPGGGGQLLPGIAVGDTRAVSDDLDAAMKASSLSHLTAVSGETIASRGELGEVIGLIELGLPKPRNLAETPSVRVPAE
ncbi:hypothetical protein, partial [Microbacterium petrolearium]